MLEPFAHKIGYVFLGIGVKDREAKSLIGYEGSGFVLPPVCAA